MLTVSSLSYWSKSDVDISDQEIEEDEIEVDSNFDDISWKGNEFNYIIPEEFDESISGCKLPFNFCVDTASPWDYLQLFMPRTFFEEVARQINLYYYQCNRPPLVRDVMWEKYGGDVTVDEIISFLVF